jgi:hypothetical protein
VLLGGVLVKLSLKIRSPEVQSGLGFRVKSIKKNEAAEGLWVTAGKQDEGGSRWVPGKISSRVPK